MTNKERVIRNITGTILAVVLVALVVNSFINPQDFTL